MIYPQLFPEARGWQTVDVLPNIHRHRPTSLYQWYDQLSPCLCVVWLLFTTMYISLLEVTCLSTFMFFKLLFLHVCRVRSLVCNDVLRLIKAHRLVCCNCDTFNLLLMFGCHSCWLVLMPSGPRICSLSPMFFYAGVSPTRVLCGRMLWCDLLPNAASAAFLHDIAFTRAMLRFCMPSSLLSMRALARISSDLIKCIKRTPLL